MFHAVFRAFATLITIPKFDNTMSNVNYVPFAIITFQLFQWWLECLPSFM
jgi:hypothetical protein